MLKLVLTSIFVVGLFSGCSQKITGVPNYSVWKIASTNTEGVTVEDKTSDGTTYKVQKIIAGKEMNPTPTLVLPVIAKAITHAKSKGFRYIQIIAPESISNANGFPLTNMSDLVSYIRPHSNNPGGFLGLENSVNVHSSLNIPLTIFQKSSFELLIREVKDPKYTDIVWDTEQI